VTGARVRVGKKVALSEPLYGRLTPELLLAALVSPHGRHEVSLEACNKDGTPAPSRTLWYYDETSESPDRVLMVIELPADEEQPSEISIDGLPAPLIVDGFAEGNEAAADVVRERLSALAPDERTKILAFLSDTLEWANQESRGLTLAKALQRLAAMIQLRAPHASVAGDQALGLAVETLALLDSTSVWVTGWSRDQDGRADELWLHAPEGASARAGAEAFRYKRPDVEQHYTELLDDAEHKDGFIAYLELRGTTRLTSGWRALLTGPGGAGEVACGPAISDPLAARRVVLQALARERIGGPLTVNHVYPAVERLQARIGGGSVSETHRFGARPVDPSVSIVVPLYGRIDFVEHQLVHFAHDPEIGECELIYVLDSPELADQLIIQASHLHRLCGIPLTLVILERNVGFGAANNAAVAEASGEAVLLLNSDVIPATGGWVGRLLAALRSDPGLGAVGPKLLFEDDTIQHAGMHFEIQPSSSIWTNAHYFKGMHRSLPQANVERDVPAVTGACMMVPRDVYRELGGLSARYVQGDYEDSDFCLRLHMLGKRVRYVPDAELYHLEAQSYPDDLRRLTRSYNSWLQTHLWSDEIERMAGL